MIISLVESTQRVMGRADFGAQVKGQTLELPSTLFTVLARMNVETLDVFWSYVQGFPSALAGALDWELTDVAVAGGRLERVLVEALPEVDWSAARGLGRTFGANRPT